MYSTNILYDIKNCPMKINHDCPKQIFPKYFSIEKGIHTLDYYFLKDLLFLLDDSNILHIYWAKILIGKYNLDILEQFFVHNDILYSNQNNKIISIYPNYKEIFTSDEQFCLDFYADKYFIINHTKNNLSERYLDIFDGDFKLYYSFPCEKVNINQYPTNDIYPYCLCNNKILIIGRRNHNNQYFDIENKIIIDYGQFREWRLINHKMVVVEIYEKENNIKLKEIIGLNNTTEQL